MRIPAVLTSLAPGGYVRARLSDVGGILNKGDAVTAFDDLAEVEVDAVVSEFHGPLAYLRVAWSTQRDIVKPPILSEVAASGKVAGSLLVAIVAALKLWESIESITWDGPIASWEAFAKSSSAAQGEVPNHRSPVQVGAMQVA